MAMWVFWPGFLAGWNWQFSVITSWVRLLIGFSSNEAENKFFEEAFKAERTSKFQIWPADGQSLAEFSA